MSAPRAIEISHCTSMKAPKQNCDVFLNIFESIMFHAERRLAATQASFMPN